MTGTSGTISANTLLHLYAPGSNGLVDFVSNVTLSNAGGAVAIAGNTVTIENGVVVTIAGQTPANVYASGPNYTGSGGNGNTRGTFGGAGATTQPLSGAPVFLAARRGPALQTKTAGSSSKKPALLVANSSQLRSLLRGASADADGKVRVTNAVANRKQPSRPTIQTTTPAQGRRHSSEVKTNTLLLTTRSQ